METNKKIFLHGMHDGIPIGIGYFAVAFSLGITARDCGFNAFQGFLSSITTYASAGQFIGYTLYAANATLLQLAIMTVITNARYLLMGFALNQRLPQGTPLYKRMLCGVAITDEIFGITIARPGYVNPWHRPWDHHGKSSSATPGQRPQRSSLWHVPGGNHPAIPPR